MLILTKTTTVKPKNVEHESNHKLYDGIKESKSNHKNV